MEDKPVKLETLQKSIDSVCQDIEVNPSSTLLKEADIHLEYAKKYYPEHHDDMMTQVIHSFNQGIKTRSMEYMFQ